MMDQAEIQQNLRMAMRGFASAVSIISATDENGVRYAMPATSVTSLSFDPPSMLVCINRTASFYPPVEAGRDFCINIPHLSQIELANNCWAKPQGEGRFEGAEWEDQPGQPPILKGAQAAIVCKQAQRLAYGTHDVVIGDVMAVYVSGKIDPILFLDGKYLPITTPA